MSTSQIAQVKDVSDKILAEVSKVIVGKTQELKLIVACFFAGGHVLLEGVPGVAKTSMAKALASSLGLKFDRIQFTPDLLPSDIVGTFIFDQKASDFKLRQGPIFANIILADEINRASPKTQIDRFLMRIEVSYPSREETVQILRRLKEIYEWNLNPVVDERTIQDVV